MDDPNTGFNVAFGLIVTLIVVGVIVSVIVAVVRAQKIASSGHNPLTLQTELELALLNSQTLAPAKKDAPDSPPAPPAPYGSAVSAPAGAAPVPQGGRSKEDRLAEIVSLHARGLITDDELATARATILASE